MDTKKIETVLTTVTIDSKVDSGKIDVVVGESAKMDVVKAVNYIQSGKAEIEAGVTAVLNQVDNHVAEKTAEFDQNAQDKTNAFNSNAVNKTGDFNDNYTSKLNAFNQNAQDKTDAFDLNASDKTGDFNTNASNKTTDFNDNYTAKKALIDAEVAVAESYSAEAKQWAIGEPSEPSEGSAKYWAEQASHSVPNDGQLDIQVNGTSVATFTANQSGNTTANIVVGSGLPSQTGNAGKVLGTDGTDASWQYALNFRGDYNNNTQYYPGDIVRYFYESMYRNFLCISAIIRRNPLAQDYWVDLTGYITDFTTSSDDCPILSYTANGWTGSRMTGIRLKVPYGQANYSKIPTINLYSGLLKVPGGIYGYYTSAQVDALIPTVNDSTITFTQGGVNKGSFTLNQSSGATIALDAGGTADLDGVTIDTNSDDELEAIGVIDNNGNAIKTWTGTLAQYNAIATKDPNTLYNITDDMSVPQTILETLYPVGSLYIGKMSTCPLASLIPNSTWTLVASDKVLQGSGTYTAGTSVSAGLPNITGSIALYDVAQAQSVANGAFTLDTTAGNGDYTGTNSYTRKHFKANFSASSSNSIYGNSTTVQPPAYVVNIWERTA